MCLSVSWELMYNAGSESGLQQRPEVLYFLQAPRWNWQYWSMDHILNIIARIWNTDQTLGPLRVELLLSQHKRIEKSNMRLIVHRLHVNHRDGPMVRTKLGKMRRCSRKLFLKTYSTFLMITDFWRILFTLEMEAACRSFLIRRTWAFELKKWL